MENYYEILHIANFAEIEVVRAAYKAMTKLYHPDVNQNVDQSVMVKINLAYEVLGDEVKKKDYDIKLKNHIASSTFYQSGKSYKKEKSEEPLRKETKRQPRTKVEKVAKALGNVLWFTADSFIEGARNIQKESEKALQ